MLCICNNLPIAKLFKRLSRNKTKRKQTMPTKTDHKYRCFILGEDTETFGPGMKMDIPSPELFLKALEHEFHLSPSGAKSQYKKLVDYDASENKNSFCGNKLVYAYYWRGLLATRYKNGKTLMETYSADPQKYWERVCKMDRRKGRAPSARDAYELNKAITFFKPSTAKFLVERFTEPGAKVFDPCAGWGGRMLGTLSAGRSYVGCDTNPAIREYAIKMIADLGIFAEADIKIMSCLDFDRGNEFDMAFTSPPYENLEVYEGMTPFGSEDDYFVNFLMPMIDQCLISVKTDCPVCINVSPKIYETLVGKYHYPECEEKIDFLQQMGQQSGKKKDYVYVWRAKMPEE